MNVTVGNNLKKLRLAKSWSQEQVADYLHISQSTYARMERGEGNSWANYIKKICEIFGIKPENLINKNEEDLRNYKKEPELEEIVNQLSEKIIEQYEARIKELKKIIKDLKKNRGI